MFSIAENDRINPRMNRDGSCAQTPVSVAIAPNKSRNQPSPRSPFRVSSVMCASWVIAPSDSRRLFIVNNLYSIVKFWNQTASRIAGNSRTAIAAIRLKLARASAHAQRLSTYISLVVALSSG